ncbi:hypothetical protein [Desulfonatronum thiodismutans]|uniref:hypothetical protein n=1 Tax=Desulfonatronum thiodismutans TaxID=159290 RepID=UPI001294874A|nr:hypothetical protein [Desulfonatronum thiodismutans]
MNEEFQIHATADDAHERRYFSEIIYLRKSAQSAVKPLSTQETDKTLREILEKIGV